MSARTNLNVDDGARTGTAATRRCFCPPGERIDAVQTKDATTPVRSGEGPHRDNLGVGRDRQELAEGV